MTQVTQGSLTLVNVNTSAPEIYWNGTLVQNIISIRVDCDRDEQRVRLKVSHMDEGMYSMLSNAGIVIKRINV